MTISKNISHTAGPVELSANLLTMISGGADDAKPSKSSIPSDPPPPSNTKVNLYGNENKVYAHVEHAVPVNEAVKIVFTSTANTDREFSGTVNVVYNYK